MTNDKQDKDQLKMPRGRFIGYLLAAVIGTSVATTFSVFRIANADHFAIIANTSEIKRVIETQKTFVSESEHNKDVRNLQQQIDQRFCDLQTHLDSRFNSLEKQID